MPIKQVIIMRTDLNMRKGKMIVQGAHAVMGIYTRYGPTDWYIWDKWLTEGATKICVGVDSLDVLLNLKERAQNAGLAYYLVTDAGRTEFPEPTITCLAIGPAESEEIDKITGNLKLL